MNANGWVNKPTEGILYNKGWESGEDLERIILACQLPRDEYRDRTSVAGRLIILDTCPITCSLQFTAPLVNHRHFIYEELDA